MIDVEAVCRGARVSRQYRVLRLLVCGGMVAVGAAVVIAAARPWPSLIFAAAIAAVWALFSWRLRAIVTSCRRVVATLEADGRAALDAPAEVEHRADADASALASNPRFAWMINRSAIRFAVAGMHDGRRVELGTAVIPGRDFDFRLSHVRVGGAAPAGAFRVMSRGFAAKMSRWHHHEREVATGDAAFDRDWVVDADETNMRRVLDDGVRAELAALHRQLNSMQTMSIEATPTGLLVRWPGPLDEHRAIELRDLATKIEARLH